MATAMVTSKGRITIPVDVREALAVKTGDRVEFISAEDGKVMIVAATKSVADLKGRFAKPEKAVAIEDMNAAIADQVTDPR